MESYIIVFKNTHDAIQSEKVLKEKGIAVVVMPTPTKITHSCGISIGFSIENIDKINEFIEKEEIVIKNIYLKKGQEFSLYK